MPDYTKIRRGKRADLGDVVWKSSWEANVARLLNALQEERHVASWQYEPHTFTFPGVTRGAVCYKPDFVVCYPDGSHEWLEVKGREEGRDRTKWKRFRKHYPEERLVVVGRAEYERIRLELGGKLKWEK